MRPGRTRLGFVIVLLIVGGLAASTAAWADDHLQGVIIGRGEGANWQTTEWREGRGRTKKVCAYHGTAHPTANTTLPRANYGVRVIDITNPSAPVNTGYLQTTSMLDPWESLKINERRQVVGAGNGANGGGPAQMDIYDVSGDCRFPQLLAAQPLGRG